MKILKDYDYFREYDPDKFIKITTKDFIFSKEDIEKYFKEYEK